MLLLRWPKSLEVLLLKQAILLVGHGSRRSEANEELAKLREMVDRKRPGSKITYGFLQFAKPNLREALAELDDDELEEVTIVPVFLYDGIHMQEDIPAILAKETMERPHLRLVLAPVLGIDERMAEIIWDRVDAAPKL